MLTTATQRIAIQFAREFHQNYLEYRESVREDYKQGYSASHCEHGMYLWTDYDPICGPCEEGYSMGDGVYRRQMALAKAKRYVEDMREVYGIHGKLIKQGLSDYFDIQRAYKAINARYNVSE